jgi:uncharacterized protein YbjT (DUF2867 family)
MSETPIVVTGAAGGQRGSTGFNTGSEGSTGNVVARLLLERGLPVRAFVHRIDERSDELSALGAEVVHGDLLDIASVRRAVVGVRRAYFVYPVQAGLLEATTTFAVAAEDAGLEIVVNNDHLVTAEDSALRHTRHHWLAEQILNHSGVGATHLRGAPFFENLWAATGQSVLADGKIYLPSGSGQRPIRSWPGSTWPARPPRSSPTPGRTWARHTPWSGRCCRCERSHPNSPPRSTVGSNT